MTARPSLRSVPPGMSATAVASIDARLDAICRAENVAIPLAVESGSRAWGFPSPDSDYDCRFLFLRPAEHYLSPWPRRDVIETPLEGELDVNGWDLGKALKLLLKGNAVVIEWLTSPIVYRGDERFRDEMLGLARELAHRDLVGRHYLHLGERQRRAYFADERAVPQKKIFYALRPAAALRWLRLHPADAVAPMHFPTLFAECEPPPELAAIVAELIARKAVTRELGSERLPQAVAAFIDAEFTIAGQAFEKPAPRREESRARAEAFFIAALRRLSPEAAA
jgi:predicted nucleotidyltransferase